MRNTYKDSMDYLEKSPQEELFVNFSDRPKGLFVPSNNPGHYDPIGIYGFSKEYMQAVLCCGIIISIFLTAS